MLWIYGDRLEERSYRFLVNYVVGLWLNSPGHCALLMDPDFTHVGVGKGHDPDNGYTYKYFWTMDVGG